MDPRSPKLLEDIVKACHFIAEDTAGATVADLERDRQRRQAVEYNFIIMGEALRRLEARDPATAARISDYRPMIGVRNRLVHEYEHIDNAQVLEIARNFLPKLQGQAETLLREAEAEFE